MLDPRLAPLSRGPLRGPARSAGGYRSGGPGRPSHPPAGGHSCEVASRVRCRHSSAKRPTPATARLDRPRVAPGADAAGGGPGGLRSEALDEPARRGTAARLRRPGALVTNSRSRSAPQKVQLVRHAAATSTVVRPSPDSGSSRHNWPPTRSRHVNGQSLRQPHVPRHPRVRHLPRRRAVTPRRDVPGGGADVAEHPPVRRTVQAVRRRAPYTQNTPRHPARRVGEPAKHRPGGSIAPSRMRAAAR